MTTREAVAEVRTGGAEPVVALAGDVDAGAERVLEGAYAEAAAIRPEAVTLDFAEVGYINSTGIALIVGVLARARADGIELRARGLSDHYREIFEITRLADFMTIVADPRSAGAEPPREEEVSHG